MECICHPPVFAVRGFEPSSTVLLGANVGFLGITSVDNGNEVSLRQISSYLSLMASFASIMLGLVFVQHNRTERWNSVFTVARFLGLLWDERHGPEKLTIVYSLPHAFLVIRHDSVLHSTFS